VPTNHGTVFDFADRRSVAKIVAGFAAALALLYLLATQVGIDRIRAELASAQLRWVALGCLSTAVGLVAWARAWKVVLGVVGVEVPFRKLVVTFYAATFANYVTPLGQAGGEPFIAYVLSRDTEASYEDSLASVVTADLLNLLPFFTFAGIGMGVLLARATLPDSLEPVAGALVVFAVGVPVIAGVGWRFRFTIGRFLLRVVSPVARRTRFLSVEGVRERMRDTNQAFQRIATEPTAMVHALVFSYVGWLFFTLPLFFAALAVASPISLLLVLFIVPASTLAGFTPSPGGTGGVEVMLSALLIGLAGFSDATAASVTILYRFESYVFAILLGGLAALYVVKRN
jgi:uncharacterized protein (TIRG00374 family)